jgi:cytochrome c-type biogenesis protein CcmH
LQALRYRIICHRRLGRHRKAEFNDEIDLMTLWFVLALMTVAAIFAVVWPLAQAGRKVRSGSDLAVYRDQLDEIGRDRAAGLIGETEAEAAKVEVSRRLLAAADAEATATATAASPAWRRRSALVAALVVLSIGSTSIYLALGSPSLPGQPLASLAGERLASRPQNQSIEALIAQIEGHLASNPNDARGWEVVAPVYLRLGRFDDAIKARRAALALGGETSERLSGLGEALVAADDGKVTDEAKSVFERAVALDAENIKARYFIGVAAEQAGRPDDAAKLWRAMLAGAPADAPWADFIRGEIARLGAGGGPSPTEQDVAAASDLSAEQRTAMIRGMIDRLAERLNRDGSDLDGWQRLVRSYMVLGDQDKARAAASDARRALAGEPDKLRRIEEFVKGLGLEG